MGVCDLVVFIKQEKGESANVSLATFWRSKRKIKGEKDLCVYIATLEK
jgi:hypothetical protein